MFTSIAPKLLPIQLVQADQDGRFSNAAPGYRIQWTGIPNQTPVELCIQREDVAFPVTNGFRYVELVFLLEALRYLNLYGQEVEVWLRVPGTGGTALLSNRQKLRAPVKPLSSPVTIREIEAETGSLPYLHLDAGDYDPDQKIKAAEYQFAGRLLSKNMDGYRYFLRARRLATFNNFRGFDCITFAASMMGLHIDLSGKTATVVAETIGAEKCGLENVKGDQIRRACAPGEKLGYHFEQFIAFYAKHTVLIGNGEVFEFSRSRKQFHRAPVHLWEGWGQNTQWTIRRIPDRYRFKLL
jgi:hypothetical protein